MKHTLFNDGNIPASALKRSGEVTSSSVEHQLFNSKRSNYFHHLPVIARIVGKIRARHIVSGVKSALYEVDLIEKGIKNPKSLDELLNEL